jgi:hypothetical protein
LEVKQVEVDGLQCLVADLVAIGELDMKVVPEVYRTCDLRSLRWLMRIGGAVR